MIIKIIIKRLLIDLAPYVILVGSFAIGKQHDGSDINLYIRSRPVDEFNLEFGVIHESYIPEILDIIKSHGFESNGVVIDHIDIPRQLGIERMIEMSSHYRIPHTNPVSMIEV